MKVFVSGLSHKAVPAEACERLAGQLRADRLSSPGEEKEI
jgi:hypothetical protein